VEESPANGKLEIRRIGEPEFRLKEEPIAITESFLDSTDGVHAEIGVAAIGMGMAQTRSGVPIVVVDAHAAAQVWGPDTPMRTEAIDSFKVRRRQRKIVAESQLKIRLEADMFREIAEVEMTAEVELIRIDGQPDSRSPTSKSNPVRAGGLRECCGRQQKQRD